MSINHKIINYIRTKNKRLVYGFIILNLFIFSSTFESLLNIPNIVKYIFSIISIFLLFNFYKKSQKIKFDSIVVYLFAYLFLLVSIYLLISSIRFELFYLQEVFAERFFFMPYLLPLLFLFVRYDLYFFKRLLQFSYILIPFAIFASFLNFLISSEE